MSFRSVVLLIVLTALSLSGLAAAQDIGSVAIPELQFNPPAVDRFVLGNGLIVHFYPDTSLPVVSLDAMFHLGEVYVPLDKAGLAELCGAVLRSGGTTKTPADQFNEKLDFVGASIHSSAGTESGEVRLRTLKKDLDLSLSLLSEMLLSPAFDNTKFEIAVENKLEEIRRENDEPNAVTRREFYKKMFPSHPYGMPATASTVSSITLPELAEFYKRFYRPDNCVMALSGDLTRSEAESLMNQYFGSWSSKGEVAAKTPALKESETGVYYVPRDMNQSHLRIGHVGIDRKNEDRYAVQVMNFILGGGGFMSRMTNRIRVQEGLAYTVGTNFYMMDESGSFYAYCQTKSESTCKAIELILDVMRTFISEGATDRELEVAKNSILNSDVFNYATPDQIAYQEAQLEFQGFPPGQLKRRIEAIKAVSLADVKRVAQAYLHPDSMIFVVVGNDKAFDKPLSEFGAVKTLQIE
jgi:predicted Zn-dependent peptidase